MAIVTLTPSACSSPAGWTVLYNYLTTNSSYYPRQLLYTYDNNSTLAGAGVNITKVTVHGYVRNSNSAVKRLRIGFRPSADSGVSDWAMLDNEAVLDQTFTAIDGYSGSGYAYAQIAREFAGNSLFARWIQQQFAAGEAVYLGVIQPDKSKSISVDTTLASWTIDVEYELLGNIPTTDKTTMNLGETVTVTINRIIADSTTSLTYKIGDTVLKTIDLETGTTDSYKALATVGGNFPNALTGTLVIEATTSKDGTTYGVITTTVVLTIPENGAPLLNCGVGQVWGNDVPSSAKLSAFVQSRTGAMLNGQFIAQYGASTAKLVFKIEGVEYEKDMAGLPQTSISGPSAITGSGTIPWSATLTDSRGLSTTRTGSITVLPYSAPKIQSFSVSRANENGKTIIDGTYAYISLQASVSSLVVSNVEKNALSFHVEYKKADETDWTVCDTVTGSSISGAFSGLLMKNGAAISDFDDLSGYSFRAVVSDIYGSSAAQDEMPTKEQIWDIDESTGNMGFGGDAPLSTDGAGYRFYRFVDFSAGYKKYSEDEVDTGNVWIDGKPIYRACVKTTSSLVNAIGVVATLPSAVDTPISLSAFVKYPGDGGWRPVPTSYSGNLSWSVLVFVAGADVSMGFGESWTGNKDIVIVIEYTKQ
jgi:hypothetical protein